MEAGDSYVVERHSFNRVGAVGFLKNSVYTFRKTTKGKIIFEYLNVKPKQTWTSVLWVLYTTVSHTSHADNIKSN